MHYDLIAIPDANVPQTVEPVFQHVLTTYASEVNKTVSVWRAVPDDLLDFKPHEKTNPLPARAETRFAPAARPTPPVAWVRAPRRMAFTAAGPSSGALPTTIEIETWSEFAMDERQRADVRA